jgi:hypothetical protein
LNSKDAKQLFDNCWLEYRGFTLYAFAEALIRELESAEREIEFLENKIEEGARLDRESESDAKGD